MTIRYWNAFLYKRKLFSLLLLTAALIGAGSTLRLMISHGQGNTTLSPLIWGSNLTLNDAQDTFLTNPTVQQDAQQLHVQMLRFPYRGDIAVTTAAAKEIAALHITPLLILPYGSDQQTIQQDMQLVAMMNSVFPTSTVYYEYGNERDLPQNGGIDAPTYTTSWNAVIPTLKPIAPHGQFVGPVNYQANPAYIAYFVQHANPRPDEVSWHEYTCSTQQAQQDPNICIRNIDNWTTHISDTRAAMQNAVGNQLPVMITEFNWNPNADNDPLRNDDTFLANWTTHAFQVLTSNQVFAANQYVLNENGTLAMIRDNSLALSGEATAFAQTYVQNQGMLGTTPGATGTPCSIPTQPASGITPTSASTSTVTSAALTEGASPTVTVTSGTASCFLCPLGVMTGQTGTEMGTTPTSTVTGTPQDPQDSQDPTATSSPISTCSNCPPSITPATTTQAVQIVCVPQASPTGTATQPAQSTQPTHPGGHAVHRKHKKQDNDDDGD